MRNLTVLFLWMIFASMPLAFAGEVLDPKCRESLKKFAIDLLHTEGYDEINTCAGKGTSDNCQLDEYPCREINSNRDHICDFRYTYGGGYPNFTDYRFTVSKFCRVQQIDIVRM
jgi:hypothetical protein